MPADRRSGWKRLFRWSLAGAALALSGHAFAVDNAAGFLVPAYGNPCCGGGVAQWSSLIALGTAHPTRLVTIVTPTFGAGGTVIDPNYVNDQGTGPLVDLIHTGSRTVGYVPMSTVSTTPTAHYVLRPLADVEHDIDLYYTNSYWRGAPTLRFAGIFFDLMPNDLCNVGYYQSLRDYVRQHYNGNATLIGNPGVSGTMVGTCATPSPVADYATVFDTLIVFEDIEADFRTGYTAPAWAGTMPSPSIAMLVHTTPASASRMRADLSFALHRGAGWVFVTDDSEPTLADTPYDTVPSFWTNEVAVLPELIFVSDFD